MQALVSPIRNISPTNTHLNSQTHSRPLLIRPFVALLVPMIVLALLAFALPALAQPEAGETASAAAQAMQQGGEFGFLEFVDDNLIPVVAIVMVFGMPALTVILLALFIFRHRERQQRLYNERLQRFLEAGQPIPEALLRGENKESTPTQHFNRGLQLVALGIGMMLCLGLLLGWKVATIGLIPLALGAARLISWKMAPQQD